MRGVTSPNPTEPDDMAVLTQVDEVDQLRRTPHRRARPASTPVYREFDAEATAWASAAGCPSGAPRWLFVTCAP